MIPAPRLPADHTLTVHMGDVAYRSVPLTPAEHHRLVVAVHNAMCRMGLQPVAEPEVAAEDPQTFEVTA